LYESRERAKLSIIILLLLLILGVLIFAAVSTIQAVRSFQHQYSAVKVGDVSTVHPWMTLHVISHIYHVPEDYLDHSLPVGNADLLRHGTLYEIANRKRQPVEQVVHTVQQTILKYRKEHSSFLTPLLVLPANIEPFSSMPGRINC